MYTYIIHNIFWWKYHNITIKVLIIMILIDSNLLQFSFGFVLLHTRNYELIYIVYLYESPKTKTRNKYYSDTYYCIFLFVIDISTLLKWKKLSAYKASCLPLIFCRFIGQRPGCVLFIIQLCYLATEVLHFLYHRLQLNLWRKHGWCKECVPTVDLTVSWRTWRLENVSILKNFKKTFTFT